MEPISSSLAKGAIDLALDRVGELLNKASLRSIEDVGRCERYLEACQAAIEGLEREYDEILIDACYVRGDAERAQQLERRIDSYLNIDRLRPRLQDAIAGLGELQQALDERAEGFAQWPWHRKERSQAVQEFAKLLKELTKYVEGLAESTSLGIPPGQTGVGVESLNSILQQLAEGPESQGPDTLEDLARSCQRERDKEPMLRTLRYIRTTIEQLRAAFA